jgi:sulfatase maturation enzyme AslB (radical SAM superfamily)
MYRDLFELVHYLQDVGFNVGLRTNGYLAEDNIKLINECKETIGYSIHTLSPTTNKMIMGRSDIPNWNWLLRHTNDCRVSIVLNRCNESEFFSIVKFISQFPKVKYIQVRRVSSDNRMSELEPDMSAYERIYTQVSKIFPLIRKFWNDAEEYSIYNKSVCFWRTIRTSVNSLNYFTDGTISDMYFIVEGYLKYMQKQPFEETGVDPERDWGI